MNELFFACVVTQGRNCGKPGGPGGPTFVFDGPSKAPIIQVEVALLNFKMSHMPNVKT